MSLDGILDGPEQGIGWCDPFVCFGVNGADGSKYFTVRPENGKAEIGIDPGFCCRGVGP